MCSQQQEACPCLTWTRPLQGSSERRWRCCVRYGYGTRLFAVNTWEGLLSVREYQCMIIVNGFTPHGLQVTLTETGQPFIIAGSGTLGWDLFAANFMEAGEHVLLINTGFFGDR